MAQYVYTMNQVGKVVPPKREILRDISLSFFPGAKIGVLGLNGSGKSTLLRIMAGIDTDIHGEARPQKGIKVGYLSQEPQLDESKDVRGNVEEALSEITDAQARLDEVYAAMPRMPNRMPILMPWLPNRPNWKTCCRPVTDTIWNAHWRSPPTHCACHPGMRT